MKKLILCLLLIIPFIGCQKRIETNCPKFPIPSKHVIQKLDELAKTDKEVWAWGNELLQLKRKLNGYEKE